MELGDTAPVEGSDIEGTPVQCGFHDIFGLVEFLADGIGHQWCIGGDDLQRGLAVIRQHVPVGGFDNDMLEVIVDRPPREATGGGQ